MSFVNLTFEATWGGLGSPVGLGIVALLIVAFTIGSVAFMACRSLATHWDLLLDLPGALTSSYKNFSQTCIKVHICIHCHQQMQIKSTSLTGQQQGTCTAIASTTWVGSIANKPPTFALELKMQAKNWCLSMYGLLVVESIHVTDDINHCHLWHLKRHLSECVYVFLTTL